MKVSRILFTLSGAALLFASAVLAADLNKGTLNVSEKVNVEGKTIDPGTYKVEWNGTGPTVQVTILHGKQTVATFPAQLTEQAAKNAVDAYGSATEADGSKQLTAIYIGGKHTVLQVDQSASQ
jgi:type 1 fimbria pilin